MDTTRTAGRTYQVRTYGCQMNVHDSERIAGLLESHGYVLADAGQQADVVVLNTCAVRENADNKLYGNLGHLASVKRGHDGMQIAVGGCLAQKDREHIVARAPWVDVVFGTHNVDALPALLRRAAVAQEAQVEIEESLRTFPSTLPSRRESAYAAWVAISVGCNNTCTFCIVPSLRGRERDRRPGEILAEVEALVADGVIEVTLLGQNVNAYGAEFGASRGLRRPAAGGRDRARGSNASGSPHRIRGTSPARSSPPWPRPRRSCPPCTCPCSRAATGSCAPCAGPTVVTASWRSSTRSGRAIPRRGDHDRHHRGLPGRDRARLRGHP